MHGVSGAKNLQECPVLGAVLLGNPVSPQLLDPICHCDRVLMLPRSHDEPAQLIKAAAVATVTGDVRIKFGSPPVCVRLRSHSMLRATMPEAAIHEDGDPRPGEDNVRAPWKVRDIHPEAESAAVQFTPNRKLRSRPDSFEVRHEATHCRARRLRLLSYRRLGRHR